MIGSDIPLEAMKHAYIVTNPVKEAKGIPNIRDHDSNIYFKVAGETLSIGGYELDPIFLDSVILIFIYVCLISVILAFE